MQGRPASDIGVAGLLAEAYEANIIPEQRWGGWKTVCCDRWGLSWFHLDGVEVHGRFCLDMDRGFWILEALFYCKIE